VNGATSTQAARELASVYCDLMKTLGYLDAHVQNFRVVNIVACVNFGHPINLPDIKKKLEHSKFEPEFFPGLSVKFSDATCVIFHSGKCNILGAKDEYEIESTMLELELFLNLKLRSL
jgi:TATA-box binding protein (TBP) (component of TFIID and TFIIIB)